MRSKKLWTQEHFVLFILAIIVYSFASYARWGGALADDGSFFLQYAKNMAAGEFWVWNLGEEPIWGSSAPLFPLFIAPLLKLGMDPINAILSVSIAFSVIAFSLVFVTIKYRFGTLSAIIFIIFTSLDSHLIWFGTNAGLETPLTFLLLSIGIMAILLAPEKSIYIGIIAGLLCVQKLDLIPAAVGLILAQMFYLKRISFVSIIIALVVALIWYGFAWIYFGLPLPNSFITKALHQGDQAVVNTREWFSTFVWIKDAHIYLFGAFVGTLLLFYKKIEWPLWIFLGAILVSHTIAYTIKFPFEPYDWYCMPSLFSLMVLGSISAAFIIEKIVLVFQEKRLIVFFIYSILIYVFIIPTIQYSINVTNSIKHYLHLEKDRENAGRWVAENTPKSFKVLTYFGNPAFFSNRFVYDGSFLNMHYVDKDIVKTYKPEVLIRNDESPKGYTLVKIFNKASDVGRYFPFGVHVRSDLLDQVTDIDTNPMAKKSVSYMDYIINKKLGDQYGTIVNLSSNKIFVHPGATTPTSFSFDVKKLVSQIPYKTFLIEIMISPEVSESAIQRGAGFVNIEYTPKNGPSINQDVSSGKPMKININDLSLTDEFNISVDPKLSADSDWVWIRFYGSK
ncbi:MAG: hypothetical protein PHY66_12800 [Aliarcobacter sp.]|nr:hypothetical protein [Aliarcobacter sp.]